MHTRRIIPCLDVKDGKVVKGINFVNLIDAGDPVENALTYNKSGADELVFLDITASVEKRDIILSLVKKVSEHLFIPYCVGGGISSMEDARMILKEGADKVAINTAAYKNPHLITELSQHFGSQCVVCAIDSKFNGNYHEVYIHGGRTPTGKNTIAWCIEAQKLGAGEILLTSMDRDGTKEGFDLPLLKKVMDVVQIPVIASGGAGKIEHFKSAFELNISACLAASVFHFKEIELQKVKTYLHKEGIPVRL